MSILRKLVTIPFVSKYMINHFAPYVGAGIVVDKIDLKNYHIRVKMPLKSSNKNIVGVHFGGSLYAMVDPFYMTLLMHHLGSEYIVWDKAANIEFLSPGRSTVFADFRLDADEIKTIKELAHNHAPVYRNYAINIMDDGGLRVAKVSKTIYIRRKKPHATRQK